MPETDDPVQPDPEERPHVRPEAAPETSPEPPAQLRPATTAPADPDAKETGLRQIAVTLPDGTRVATIGLNDDSRRAAIVDEKAFAIQRPDSDLPPRIELGTSLPGAASEDLAVIATQADLDATLDALHPPGRMSSRGACSLTSTDGVVSGVPVRAGSRR